MFEKKVQTRFTYLFNRKKIDCGIPSYFAFLSFSEDVFVMFRIKKKIHSLRILRNIRNWFENTSPYFKLHDAVSKVRI